MSDDKHVAQSMAYCNRGVAHALAGRYADALDEFEQAVFLNPSNYFAVNSLGNTLLQLKKPTEALEVFSQLAKQAPHYWAGHFNLANSLKNMGRHQEAIEAYEQTLVVLNDPSWSEAVPKNVIAQVHNQRGEALKNMGLIKAAREAFKAALEHDPHNLSARQNLESVQDSVPFPAATEATRPRTTKRKARKRRAPWLAIVSALASGCLLISFWMI